MNKKSRSKRAEPEPRARDSAVTREAILDSARDAFARAGYDGAGLREIAAGAGVTAMMIGRYFGSKENLFAEVTDATMREPTIMTPENLKASDPADAFATALTRITDPEQMPLIGFQIMLRSAASDVAARIGRERIEAGYQKTLTSALRGDGAAQRAALALSLVVGVQMMRQMVGLSALVDADPEELRGLLEPMFRSLFAAPASKRKTPSTRR